MMSPNAVMNATVLQTNARSLMVRDAQTGQEVLVHFNNARAFSPGDTIRITFNGIMTPSIPPQITATSIVRVGPQVQPPPSASEIRRATVLQVRNGALLVRDQSNNQQILVNYPHAHHFCARQVVSVLFDTITFGNPTQVSATDIRPLC